MRLLKQSTARAVDVIVVASSDHIAGATGKTLTIYASKNGGSAAAITPTVTETSSTNMPGVYSLALTTSHSDTLGDLTLHVTATGCDPTTITFQVVTDLTGASVASVTGNVGGNVVGSVASVTARVTANTDQLAGQTVTAAAGVTFPTSVASPTNITAGTITTVTNLTNAPTAGDLTATMKTSVTTAATAATPIAASVTGNVGGNVTGSVGSVASGGITSASFASGAINAAAIATDAIGAAELASDAIAEIVAGVLDEAIASHVSAGTVAAAINNASVTASKVGDTLQIGAGSPSLYQFTSAALENAPSSGSAPTAAQVADAVWDEARSGHVTAGTFGEGVASVQGDVTGSVDSVIGDIGGNVVGSVASVVGNVGGSVASVAGNVSGSVASVAGNVTGSVGSVTGNVGGNVTGSVASVASGGITAASFATDAIDANALKTDAVTEIQSGLSTLTAAGVRTAVGLGSANLDTQLAGISAVTLKLDYTLEDSGESPTRYRFSTESLEQLFGYLMDGGYSFEELARGWSSALLGKASGMGTTTAVFRSVADDKDRITGTVDSDGDRSAVTLDLTP